MGTVSNEPKIKRRHFLAGAVAAAPIAGLAGVGRAAAQESGRSSVPAKPQTAGDTQPPREMPPLVTGGKVGGDYMVDVLKALDIDYVASTPGSTFRGLQESIINYGMNKKPEFITTIHEEASVALAHGYAKISGKPMASMVHGVVGLQHSSMAIYNAFCDQVPIVVMAGNVGAGTKRRPGVEWAHSAHDQAIIVRDYTKWDDQAVNLEDFGEGLVRAYDIATTVPMGPTLVVVDAEQQEEVIEPGRRLVVPKLNDRTQPSGDPNALAEAAKMLANAENPLIIVGRYTRSEVGPKQLVQLVELLQCPVVDVRNRMNMPNRHPLNHTQRAGAAIRQADVVLGIEVMDMWGELHTVADLIGRPARPRTSPGVKVITLGTTDAYIKPNMGEYERYQGADLAITGDGETSLPYLIQALEKEMTPARQSVASARGQKLMEMGHKFLAAADQEAAYGWNASPVSTARLSAELWNQIKNEDWTMATEVTFLSNWPYRLWSFEKHFNSMGGSVGGGVGYNAPAALGAALANKEHGRITVALNGDGDLMMSPGVLWTAAHHQIPILYIIHNNRAWHQEFMHVQRMAQRNQRGIERAHIGTTMWDPNIEFSMLATSMGVYSPGTIENPGDLGPALQKALAVVKKGEPALINVVSQPR
jgi:acetolactate synthase I/II/III large subunit